MIIFNIKTQSFLKFEETSFTDSYKMLFWVNGSEQFCLCNTKYEDSQKILNVVIWGKKSYIHLFDFLYVSLHTHFDV